MEILKCDNNEDVDDDGNDSNNNANGMNYKYENTIMSKAIILKRMVIMIICASGGER